MEPIAFFVLIFFVCIVAVIVLINSYIFERKSSKNSSNFNIGSGRLYYLLEENKDAFLEKIIYRSISDMDDYIYDPEKSLIILENNGSHCNLGISFYTVQGYEYMVVTIDSSSNNNSKLPLILNTFFKKRFSATPVEVSYFEALVNNNNIQLWFWELNWLNFFILK